VIGAGAIGIEMATICRRMGTDVTVLELLPTVLPGCDREMGARLERVLKMQGLKVHTRMRIESGAVEAGRAVLRGTDLKTQAPFEFGAERVLLATGRRPNSESIHAGTAFVPISPAGFVEVDEFLETRVPGIYAIGDLIGGKLLAHKASHEGLSAAAAVAGRRAPVDHRALPMAVFTEPEFASVGWTEDEARARVEGVRTGTFSFQANGRALTMDSSEGLVKIVTDAADRILGAHILGPSASELLAELTLALRLGLTVADVGETIHIHPTLSEAAQEAALKVRGEAIHALNT
jgi:dihydrolipoamide dehydrogenase